MNISMRSLAVLAAAVGSGFGVGRFGDDGDAWRSKSRAHVRDKAWHSERLRTPDLN
jgi:hypothetical protein